MFEFFCNVNIKMKLFFLKLIYIRRTTKAIATKNTGLFKKRIQVCVFKYGSLLSHVFFLTIISIQRAKRYFCSLSFDSTVKIFSGQSPKFFKVLFTSVDFILFFNFSFRKKKKLQD